MSTVAWNETAKPADLPPMLQQYVEYKGLYPDCLLLFQVGDFYELFFEDAVTVSRVLNLTLTSRDKNSPNPIPMCGVPIAVVDAYIARLVAARYSAAIVSQSASLNSQGKQVISRFLERIVTPGIKILGRMDKDSEESVVAAAFLQQNELSIAFSNVQTGKIFVRENIQPADLSAELSRIQPIELILPSLVKGQKLDRRITWVADIERKLPYCSIKSRVTSSENENDGRQLTSIKGYPTLSSLAKKAVQLLLSYIDETTVTKKINITEISEEVYQGLVAIDATSKRNLELVENLKDGSSEATLFDFVNHCITVGGERFLKQNILNPLTDLEKISGRQDAISELIAEFTLRAEVKEHFKYISDLERIAARIELAAVLPREVMALRESLEAASLIQKKLVRNEKLKTSLLADIIQNLEVPAEITGFLERALHDNPEATLTQGGIIRDGYSSELDALRAIKEKGSSWIAELEASEKVRTGINSLKIKYNNIIGYFIEITNANSSKIPEDFIRKQTTANTERFTTHELRAREKDLMGAESKLIELERRLFEDMRTALKEHVELFRKLADTLSRLDFLCSLAECSERYDLSRPVIDESSDLIIEEGKHPVLMKILKESYVPTSLNIISGEKNFLIITGPNMGGKSTYLRQAALITVLAQMGSNVPAKKCSIGIVDKIFARLGASDNQQEGESTFMVEMREASHIIAGAGPKSLLLIDEIGRGTATADGLSIAQAILEWIVQKINCRSLFATHFHELTELSQSLSGVVNYSVNSYEENGEVIFTHDITPGPASSSYGIEVAKLAGLPQALLSRARDILSKHVKNKQLPLFDVPKEEKIPDGGEFEKMEELRKKLNSIEINNITPLESLNLLSELIRDANT
jgi:DNA mismatch repair protein MutS